MPGSVFEIGNGVHENGNGVHLNGKGINGNGNGVQETLTPLTPLKITPQRPTKVHPRPPAYLKPFCHPLEPQVTEEVDRYFIESWGFNNDEKAIQKFRDAGFSRVTCNYYPTALDDRIHFACRLLTVLFLIDDQLEDMSFQDGKVYNEGLMPIARGEKLPDRSKPAEFIMWDLYESMRECDHELANAILEPMFTFMRAQTDPKRNTSMGLGDYMEYREGDVGKALLSALMRFVMNLHLTPEEFAEVKPVDLNCSKHISVVNDIFSWEKELKQSQDSKAEGSVICSAVQVVAEEAKISTSAAKRVLWAMCREWELVHIQLMDQRAHMRHEAREYMKGLEYQMSGNEMWSSSTKRYLELEI